MAHVDAAALSPVACTLLTSPSARAPQARPRRFVIRALLLALLFAFIATDVASWLQLEARAEGGPLLRGRRLTAARQLSRTSRRARSPTLLLFAHARPAAVDPRSGDQDNHRDDDTDEMVDDDELDEENEVTPVRDPWGSVAQHTLTELNYETGLKPFMTPWRELRRMLRDAGCHTTMDLPRLTYPPRHQHHHRHTPADSVDDAPPLPGLCRKPLVLMSGRGANCGSCTHFARDVLSNFRAEWEYLRAHVTLVDAGDPMTEQLIRHAYPLWYDPAELRQRLTLTKVPSEADSSHNTNSSADSEDVKLREMQAAMRQSDEADYAIYDTDLRQRAALLMRAPAPQASHRWSRMVKDAYAGQREYLLRIVFAYPHNGSVMRDVVNEAVAVSGSAAKNLHFFTTAAPFFHCAKKAVRVMEWLQNYGDY